MSINFSASKQTNKKRAERNFKCSGITKVNIRQRSKNVNTRETRIVTEDNTQSINKSVNASINATKMTNMFFSNKTRNKQRFLLQFPIHTSIEQKEQKGQRLFDFFLNQNNFKKFDCCNKRKNLPEFFWIWWNRNSRNQMKEESIGSNSLSTKWKYFSPILFFFFWV